MCLLYEAHVQSDDCSRCVPVRSVHEDGEPVSESDAFPVSLSSLDDEESDSELTSLSSFVSRSSSSSGGLMSNTDDPALEVAHAQEGGVDQT